MTFKRRKGRNDIPYYTIFKRLLGMNLPEEIKIRLKDMLNKRHQLVHGGKYDIISLSDFNLLKGEYERLLSFLMDHNNKFKTIDEIELIYDKSGRTREDLEEEIGIINYLIEQKKKPLKIDEDKIA
ncbi:MAG: hypothetical protein C5S38_09575 [Candidatus Methanophagaceae archaeon]|nr:MAG: hypothetical protein C5S38_09575 [Methanophagales archaeon]